MEVKHIVLKAILLLQNFCQKIYVLYFLISEVWLKRWILWKDSGADETIDSPEIPLSAYSLYTDPEVQKFMLKNKLISKRRLKNIDKMAKCLNL